MVIEIAAATAMRIGQAFALDAEHCPALRAFGNFQTFFPAEAGNLELRAQRGLRNAQRNRAIQIGAPPLEERVLLHLENNVKIPRRPAIWAGFALALNTKPRPGVHTRWYS